MKEILGKIEWIADGPTEYPAGSNKYNLNMKLHGSFYNRDGEIKELEILRKRLNKGYEIKIDVLANKIQSIEVISDKVEKAEGNFSDDLTSFEDLLSDAHSKGLINIFTVKEEIDLEKKYALFKAVVMMIDDKGVKREFQAHGDATDNNITGSFIKPHFIRMAETRAISRALRWATNNAKTAREETAEGTLPEESKK